jgi:GTP cyclohydrolase II
VERAISDLRRGEPVLLQMKSGPHWRVTAGEFKPTAKALSDATHPAVILMKLAGLLPRAILQKTTATQGLLTVTEKAIRQYPATLATSLIQVSEAHVPLPGAENTRIIAFRPRFGHEEHLAVIIGDPTKQKAPYVRVHSSCVTGDVFGSLRCDCGNQLHKAIAIIAGQKAGVILYLSQEGRGIGIASKLRAYGLQDKGMDTVQANEALGFAADERDFALASAILKQLGLPRITLITNNPAKIAALTQNGIHVEKRIPLVTEVGEHNRRYLSTKEQKMGHHLHDMGDTQ